MWITISSFFCSLLQISNKTFLCSTSNFNELTSDYPSISILAAGCQVCLRLHLFDMGAFSLSWRFHPSQRPYAILHGMEVSLCPPVLLRRLPYLRLCTILLGQEVRTVQLKTKNDGTRSLSYVLFGEYLLSCGCSGVFFLHCLSYILSAQMESPVPHSQQTQMTLNTRSHIIQYLFFCTPRDFALSTRSIFIARSLEKDYRQSAGILSLIFCIKLFSSSPTSSPVREIDKWKELGKCSCQLMDFTGSFLRHV